MKEIVQHPIYGEIVYDENIWTGKKSLFINGIKAQSVSKKEFTVNDKTFTLKGSFINGVNLYIEGETVLLSPKPKWYEFVLAFLPLLFLVTWGNNAYLCYVFPVVGGALGGGLGGACSAISLYLIKNQKNLFCKILVGLVATAVTVFIAFILALVLIQSESF